MPASLSMDTQKIVEMAMQPFHMIHHQINKQLTMKKLLLPLLILPLFAEAQTIPNGDFESWAQIGITINPESWITDNTEIMTTVSKDLESYEGEFAMRVTAQPTGVGDYGEAYTEFEINAIPPALNFYAKSEIEFGAARVEITFMNQFLVAYSNSWTNTESITEYTAISIPLEQIEPVITHVIIKVIAEVGDLVPGTAWISVDAMEFGDVLNVDKKNVSAFKIYPNPVSDILTIQSTGNSLGKLTITDAVGKIVMVKQVTENPAIIDIQHLVPGIYMIHNNENLKPSRFIVQ